MSPALQTIAVISLAIGAICAAIIAIDLLAGHPQHMWIMNLVWPITALYAAPLALWGYFTAGRLSTKRAMMDAKTRGEDPPGKKKPFWQMVALGATHCGSGCTLADIVGEWALVLFPLTLFGMKSRLRPRPTHRHFLPILHHRADAEPLVRRRSRRREQSRLPFPDRVAGRDVWLDGDRDFRDLRSRDRENEPGLLVHDADRDAGRIPDQLPGELVAAPGRD
jgi:hypothetical protein